MAAWKPDSWVGMVGMFLVSCGMMFLDDYVASTVVSAIVWRNVCAR